MSVTISIVQDTRRAKLGNKYPLKLRVIFERHPQYYPTIYDLTEVDYQKLSATRLSADLLKVKEKLKELERLAESVIKVMEPFSFADFERKFVTHHPLLLQKKIKAQHLVSSETDFDYAPFYKKFPLLLEDCSNPISLAFNYKIYVQKLVREGRISSAVNYHCSYVSLKKFRGNVNLTTITSSFLTEYENAQKQNNISKTTIGIYLRPLRAIFNEAIEQGIILKQKSYPFGRRKYQIPGSRNIKKALDLSDIEKIYRYQSSTVEENEQRAKDFWLFSYFGNGMNPKDIANLKYKDLHGDYLVFERSKTERTQRSDPKQITVYLTNDMKTIIQKWGNKNSSSDNYIFPVLTSGLTPLRQYDIIQNFIKLINDHMRNIGQRLGIEKKVTTYVARHSFSTILKRSGASTEFIQEALGHSNLKTTEHYLGSFEKEIKKEFASRLTAFSKTATESSEMI